MLTPSPSFHLQTLLGGMTENRRYPPSLIQSGPSVHSKPPASTSISAPGGINLSKRGSLRRMLPSVLCIPPPPDGQLHPTISTSVDRTAAMRVFMAFLSLDSGVYYI